MSGGQVYCLDTSSLLEGYNRLYPPEVFFQLWINIEQLIQDKRVVAPQLVYAELAKKDDNVFAWAKARKQMFMPIDIDQISVTYVIAREFPVLGTSLLARDSADPFVIALARSKNYLVVTEEKGESERRPKIPQICRRLDVPHINFLGMVRAEGWRF